MNKSEIKERLLANKVVAVVRTKDSANLLKVVEALKEGGVIGIELTMTIPDPIKAIEEAAKHFGDDILLGVGSITNADDAKAAMNAGAEFVVSPILKKEVVDAVLDAKKVAIPGCFTPTEIQNAHDWGADFAKIFPANILGMDFIKGIKAPLPHLNVIPTGGVTIENATEWIKSGAAAVGIGSALVDNKAIAEGNYALLTEKAKQLAKNLGLS